MPDNQDDLDLVEDFNLQEDMSTEVHNQPQQPYTGSTDSTLLHELSVPAQETLPNGSELSPHGSDDNVNAGNDAENEDVWPGQDGMAGFVAPNNTRVMSPSIFGIRAPNNSPIQELMPGSANGNGATLPISVFLSNVPLPDGMHTEEAVVTLSGPDSPDSDSPDSASPGRASPNSPNRPNGLENRSNGTSNGAVEVTPGVPTPSSSNAPYNINGLIHDPIGEQEADESTRSPHVPNHMTGMNGHSTEQEETNEISTSSNVPNHTNGVNDHANQQEQAEPEAEQFPAEEADNENGDQNEEDNPEDEEVEDEEDEDGSAQSSYNSPTPDSDSPPGADPEPFEDNDADNDGQDGEGGEDINGAEDEDELEDDDDIEEDDDEPATPFDAIQLGLKEISNLGKIIVSSYKPGNGVDELRSDDLSKLWQ